MEEGIRKILERPFPSELLKQRQGPGGKTFTYVEVQHYVDRLNLAFGGAWSWEVTKRDQIDDQLVIEGRLTAGGITKTGLGGSVITRRRDDGQMVGLADSYKVAEADAIKRACRLLGIGGHLYGSEDEEVGAQPPVARPPMQSNQRPPQRPLTTQRPSAPQQQQERSRLTGKQLNALWAIARNQGLGETEFRSHCVEVYGSQPEYLTRQFASQLISSLGNSKGNGHDRQPTGGR